jgi:hypothetical protein
MPSAFLVKTSEAEMSIANHCIAMADLKLTLSVASAGKLLPWLGLGIARVGGGAV